MIYLLQAQSQTEIPTEQTSTSTASPSTSSDTTEEQEPQCSTFRAPATSRTQKSGIKRKTSEQDVDSKVMNEALQVIQSSVPSSNDPYFTYALNSANELRKYDAKTLAHIKRAFANIIFDADMGVYSTPSPSYDAHFQTPVPHASPSESSSTSNDCIRETSLLESNITIESVLLDI
nr:unnamed protein product [Callosobruchus chinensis]